MTRYTHTDWQTKDKTFHGYLILDRDGGMRLSRGEAALKKSERSLKVEVRVPESIFKTPTLTAKISVSEDDAPAAITAETIAGIEEAIRGSSDLTINIVAENLDDFC